MRRLIVVGLALGLSATACDYRGATSLPLPGGVGTDGYRVTAVFDDVTNLVPKETCRAGDVVVGTVESVTLDDDLKAEVVCRIDSSITLAGNAVATLRQTSLLGERYVALDPPAGQRPRGDLAPGARIEESDTHVVPDTEVVFSALSQVLNGGGLSNIETISHELSTALSGSDLGGTVQQLSRFTGTLGRHRSDIVAALEALDRLTSRLRDQRSAIGSALDAVPSGLAALERQRPALIRTLTSLGDLSRVAVPLIAETKTDTVADLQDLSSVLDDISRAKSKLAKALEGLVTFPFPSYTKYVTKGDYAGMFATFAFDLDSLNHLLASKSGTSVPSAPTSGSTSTPGLPDLTDLLGSLPSLDGVLPDLLSGSIGGLLDQTPPRTLGDLLKAGAS